MIEAWVTDPAGKFLAALERTDSSPFRAFAFGRELNGIGSGRLEYHLDNELLRQFDDLLAFGNLVWMYYQGRTVAWIIEQRQTILDDQEHASDWVRVSGRGTRQLLADRIVWPTEFDEAHTNPLLWGSGGWQTTLSATANAGQKVVPVASTTGASIGIPVEITGGGHKQIGIIESILAGVSVTLEDPLAFTFPSKSRIVGATKQWRRFVNRAAGEMLWELIAESNDRFVADGGPAIVRGTVERTGADGWTQDFRFDNLEEVVSNVEAVYGDVEVSGLTFNYRNAQGVDRTETVIFEEGADLLRCTLDESDRDTINWIVAEGTGEAVYAKIQPKKKPKKRPRKTPVRRPKPKRRKAPEAPKKVEYIRVDFPILATEEEVDATRRREAYLEAKDVKTTALLDEVSRAALEEHAFSDQVGLEVLETRYRAGVDFDLGDWVRAISPSRGIDEDVRIVSMYVAEADDDRVRVQLDVNTAREDHLLNLDKRNRQTTSSLGVVNRQPQGQLVPFSFSGQGVFDQDDTLEVHLWIPDRIDPMLEAKVSIDFRPFFAPAKSAASGGGSTSGASSTSTSGASSKATADGGGSHDHALLSFIDSTPGAVTKRRYGAGGMADILQIEGPAKNMNTGLTTDHAHGMAHTHGIAHDHSTPNHTHAIVYGIFKEAYPASHDVTLKVYELEAGAWVLRGTVPGLTGDQAEVDLSQFIPGPGQWRLDLVSAAGQPNGGRLAAYVSGYVLGAIQSA